MDDAGDRSARWLLLIFQLPTKRAYLRVKVWRRLQTLGAVAVKNSVYALPANEGSQEDFEWLLKEVVEGGGDGLICEASLTDRLAGDEHVRALFNAARDTEYEMLAKAAQVLAESLRGGADDPARFEAKTRLKRLQAEAARIVGIDFFGANGREPVEGLLGALEAELSERSDMTNPVAAIGKQHWPAQQRVWVTRQGVHVDRIASAWLIRRFIDPAARFKFVAANGYVAQAGDLRFDMFEAEFTHKGDACTFEVLLAHSGITDPALLTIGQIVHDIDLKDRKFSRDEVSGVLRVIEGISAATSDDMQRIERGTALFDDLYASFRRRPA